jgi:sugar phosphate permease
MNRDNLLWTAWREKIFTAAWILYAGYYICRKDISASKGIGITSLAVSLACFGAMYAVGQVAGGIMADRIGGRRTALFGATISVLCTLALSVCNAPLLMLILQLGNGFGQGFGWPSLVKLLGGWFRDDERNIVLSWWSTSYILGGLLASSINEWLMLYASAPSHPRFHPAYIASASLLVACAFLFFKETHNLPETPAISPVASERLSQRESWKELLSNRSIRFISAVYFFLKMTRYTLLFWLPNYLVTAAGYRPYATSHVASYFELFGFLGPLATGYAVQRYFKNKLLAVGAGMLFALAFLCLLHPLLASSSTFALVSSIALMGILIHGADILISGMAVLDVVPAGLHGRAVGLVNAVGSIGQALSPLLITVYVSHLGWTSLFDLFVFFALVAGSLCAFGARQNNKDKPALNRSVLEPVHTSH